MEEFHSFPRRAGGSRGSSVSRIATRQKLQIGSLTALALLASLAALAQISTEAVTVVTGSGREAIPVRLLANIPMVPLEGLAPFVGGSIRAERGSGTATLAVGDRAATISSGRSLVPVEGKLVLLSAPTTVREEGWFVPLDFLGKVLPLLSPHKIAYRPQERLLVIGESFPRLSVRAFPHSGYTRVVIESTSALAYQVSQEQGRVSIQIQTPYLETDFENEEIADGVVSRLRLSRQNQGYLFEVELGDRFLSMKAFQLANPDRMVLDLFRKGPPAEIAAPEPAPAPPAPGPPEPPPPVEQPAPLDLGPGIFRTITLDPGHGGAESGARGPNGVLEKDVTLSIARKLRGLLENRLGIRVVLTRDGDQNLGLDERTAMANNNKSDLFISIHANASRQQATRGTETYFLSLEASDDESRRLALAENASALPPAGPGRADRDLDFILWDMAQAAYLTESATLAEILQQEMNAQPEEKNRGIKQAPFRVLMGAAMPAVLIEVGFISNPEEEQLLASSEFQSKLAQAIFRGVLKYKERYERKVGWRGTAERQRLP